MTVIINIILITFILLVFILGIFFHLKQDDSATQSETRMRDYQLDNLTISVKDTINTIQNTNITELHLNEVETKKREDLKFKLDRSIRESCTGDIGAKEYLKEYISELLINKYKINEISINYVVPFHCMNELDVMKKFDILLFKYGKENKKRSMSVFFKSYKGSIKKTDSEGNVYYALEAYEVEEVFSKEKFNLTFVEKLDLVSQWIYQSIAGHGVIDLLREDLSIDGICGGVSGVEQTSYMYVEELLYESNKMHNRYDSIWLIYSGQTMRLSFLSFKKKSELERVTHNLYRNGNPGWLSSLRGYILNDTKDGDRVTCVRPPFSESFGFFIRKFGSVNPQKLENVITDEGAEIPITLIKSLIRGCVNIVYTGQQDCGKTTLLKASVKEIDDSLSIRTIELFLEMWLSRLYPNKNIMGFRNTENISFSEAISVMKKSTGNVMIGGESADHISAAKVVELALVGTKFTLSTCHPDTTDGTIEYHTNSVMSPEVGLYSDDQRAEASVAKALNIDVHLTKNLKGDRYIERITEIIPKEDKEIIWPDDLEGCQKLYYKLNTRQKTYTTKDIVVFENNRYVLKCRLSKRLEERLRRNLTESQWEIYEVLMSQLDEVS